MVVEPVSVWVPEPKPRTQAVIGKLTEEAGELIKILGRIQAQGLNGVDPDTGQHNIHALEEEIADVRALCSCAITLLNLDHSAINDRSAHKIRIKLEWLFKL